MWGRVIIIIIRQCCLCIRGILTNALSILYRYFSNSLLCYHSARVRLPAAGGCAQSAAPLLICKRSDD